ncbi:MAG: DUF3017 domain-containing protein [Actinomycetota bacterium]|nr:DUF3017 domain-containing protein [Actinomycetota bacterium]
MASPPDGPPPASDVAFTPESQRRRWYDEWPIIGVLAGVACGLAVVAVGRFREGTVVMAVSVVLASILRAVLPERRAGLLVVRSRVIDVVTSAAMGAALLALALVVPPPPP